MAARQMALTPSLVAQIHGVVEDPGPDPNQGPIEYLPAGRVLLRGGRAAQASSANRLSARPAR